MTLLAQEYERYAQQLKLPEIGLSGQLRLKQAKVLCIGAGGLGSPLLLYLAAAGIGHLGIIDNDILSLSNLQRQILYHTKDVGGKKAALAKNALLALNPHLNIEIFTERFTHEYASQWINNYDIIADCADNFATTYLINDVCFHLNKPWVNASVSEWLGHCALFHGKPCFRCLFPPEKIKLPAGNCNEQGVISVLPGLLGLIQATKIIHWILQLPQSTAASFLTIDTRQLQFKEFQMNSDPECGLCMQQKPLEAVHPLPACSHEQEQQNYAHLALTPQVLFQQIKQGKALTLLDVRSYAEHAKYNIGGSLIPLPELAARLNELNPKQPLIVYCHSGYRSLEAAKLLLAAGFEAVQYSWLAEHS